MIKKLHIKFPSVKSYVTNKSILWQNFQFIFLLYQNTGNSPKLQISSKTFATRETTGKLHKINSQIATRLLFLIIDLCLHSDIP